MSLYYNLSVKVLKKYKLINNCEDVTTRYVKARKESLIWGLCIKNAQASKQKVNETD